LPQMTSSRASTKPPLGQQLDELTDRLDALEAESTVSWQKVRTAVKDVVGSPAGDVVNAEPFRETVRRLRDSLIAIKVLSTCTAPRSRGWPASCGRPSCSLTSRPGASQVRPHAVGAVPSTCPSSWS